MVSREVSCICESCLYGDSAECLNKAYVSNWKTINLLTGKPVVEEYYVNKHWSREKCYDDTEESNDESNITEEILAKCTTPAQNNV